MRTILIAHGDVELANGISGQLVEAGYRTIVCPGPWPPAMRCIRCDVGYCPLTEGTDAMIYDPELTGLNQQGQPYNLAVDSARAHPEVPLLLAWRAEDEPAAVSEVLREVPSAQPAARDGATLVAQIQALIGNATDAGAAHPALIGIDG